MAIPTLKKVGRRQREIIRRMCKDGLMIRHWAEDGKGFDYMLCDEDGNDYELLSHSFVWSLMGRGIFYTIAKRPRLGVQVREYRMKPDLIEETLLIIGHNPDLLTA